RLLKVMTDAAVQVTPVEKAGKRVPIRLALKRFQQAAAAARDGLRDALVQDALEVLEVLDPRVPARLQHLPLQGPRVLGPVAPGPLGRVKRLGGSTNELLPRQRMLDSVDADAHFEGYPGRGGMAADDLTQPPGVSERGRLIRAGHEHGELFATHARGGYAV